MGASQMLNIVPLLLWVGIICLIIGLGVAIFQKRMTNRMFKGVANGGCHERSSAFCRL